MESILSVGAILNEIDRRRAALNEEAVRADARDNSPESLRLRAESVALGELRNWIREQYVMPGMRA